MLNARSGVSNCCLDVLDKLQKQVSKTLAPALAFFLAPLGNHQNVKALLK